MSNIVDAKLPFVAAHSWLSRPAPGANKPVASKHPRVRISSAHHEWNHIVIVMIALRKGFWSDEGLTDVELVTLESEAISLEGISQGIFDFAIDPASHYVVKAIREGSDMYVIGPRRGSHAFYLFGQKGMKTVKDLKGGRIYVFTPGDEMTVQSSQVISDAGMVPNVDVRIELFEGEMHDVYGMEDAFRRGEAQGLLAVDLQVPQLQAEGFPILLNLKEAYLPRQDRVMVANGNIVRNHPETVQAYLKGTIRANHFFMDKQNREEIIGIIEEAGFSQGDQRLFDLMFDMLYYRIPPDCHLPLEGIDQVIKEQIAAGNIDNTITRDRILRLDPLYKAQKELGIVPG